MADPLSPATRATKRNLLIASVVAVSANAFNISIDKIPVAGLSINFDDRLFAFLLVVTLSYFLATFVLYYVIDIKNLEATPHQDQAEKSFEYGRENFELIYLDRIQKELAKLLPPDHDVSHIDSSGNQINLFQYREHPSEVTRHERNNLGNRVYFRVTRADNPTLFRGLDERVDVMLARYESSVKWFSVKQRALILGTRLMYLARNYFFDGFLPITLGVFAMVAILGHVDLHWIQYYLPSFKVLSQ